MLPYSSAEPYICAVQSSRARWFQAIGTAQADGTMLADRCPDGIPMFQASGLRIGRCSSGSTSPINWVVTFQASGLRTGRCNCSLSAGSTRSRRLYASGACFKPPTWRRSPMQSGILCSLLSALIASQPDSLTRRSMHLLPCGTFMHAKGFKPRPLRTAMQVFLHRLSLSHHGSSGFKPLPSPWP